MRIITRLKQYLSGIITSASQAESSSQNNSINTEPNSLEKPAIASSVPAQKPLEQPPLATLHNQTPQLADIIAPATSEQILPPENNTHCATPRRPSDQHALTHAKLNQEKLAASPKGANKPPLAREAQLSPAQLLAPNSDSRQPATRLKKAAVEQNQKQLAPRKTFTATRDHTGVAKSYLLASGTAQSANTTSSPNVESQNSPAAKAQQNLSDAQEPPSANSQPIAKDTNLLAYDAITKQKIYSTKQTTEQANIRYRTVLSQSNTQPLAQPAESNNTPQSDIQGEQQSLCTDPREQVASMPANHYNIKQEKNATHQNMLAANSEQRAINLSHLPGAEHTAAHSSQFTATTQNPLKGQPWQAHEENIKILQHAAQQLTKAQHKPAAIATNNGQSAREHLRKAYLDDAGLAKLAQQLAQAHQQNSDRTPPWRQLKASMQRDAKNLLQIFYIFNEAALSGENIPPSAHWLIDNYYILDKTYQQLRQELSAKLYRKLGAALELCQTFLEHRDSVLNLKSLEQFMLAYQDIRPLNLAEIGALPSCLRLILLQKASSIAANLQNLKNMQLLSTDIFEQLHSKKISQAGQPSFLANFQARLSEPSFVASFYYQLREQKIYSIAANWLKENVEDCQAMASAFEAEQADNCTSMANIINSIKTLDNIDWEKHFARLSVTDKLLSEQCEYNQLDSDSRALCRQAIEQIAQQSPMSELQIAQKAIAAIKTQHNTLGYYLLGAGRQRLEQACSCKLSLPTKARHLLIKHGFGFMLSYIVLISGGLCWALYHALRTHNAALPILFTLLFICLAMEVGFALFNKFISIVLPHRKLCGYGFAHDIPDSYRTLVAVPSLLINKANIDELIQRLEANYISNAKGELYYALITDWIDSNAPQNYQDKQLLDYAQTAIAKLNQLHAAQTRPRFFLAHRQRVFNSAQNCYMGWERKRGKLHELAQLLRGHGNSTSFMPVMLPKAIKYLIVLDSDTKLLPGSAAKLIGKLAYSQKSHNNYSILQPRIINLIAPAKFSSKFQQIFANTPGIDPYSSGASDSYQDLFGQGIYIGKGIYDIDAFETALQGKIAENSVLSHDLLEGCYSGCAFVSDVILGEEYPASYKNDASRLERWARGDWQLLPYIWRGRHDLKQLDIWKMLDNLRRWLLAPLFLIGYFLSYALLPPPLSLIWQLSALACLFAAPLIALLSGALHKERNIYLSSYFTHLAKQTSQTMLELLAKLCFLAHSGWYQSRALIVSLYRMFISRKYLLEWKSAGLASLEAQNLGSFVQLMLSSMLIAGLAIALQFITTAKPQLYFSSCALLWLIAPFVAYGLSQTGRSAPRISSSMEEQFKAIGERIWRFYENFCNAEHNHLPIDNYQEDNGEKIATRTSPTNIGMYLLSIIAAHEFGWIGLETALERLENCLQSLKKLALYKGHLYNWYDIKTLQPIPPFTISTVDSGNLAGHLIALSSALTAWGRQSPLEAINKQRLALLAAQARDFAMAMDFKFLLCPKKQLLSIGYDIKQRKLLPGCYDMLASEARLGYYVAIAKGDVPYKIWSRMGRLLTSINGKAALLSWSGSMFEYLMPPLVLREETASLTGQTNRLIIKKQIAYGKIHNHPWGISEAAFNSFDTELNYQYSNFGVPDLGLKRALGKDYVAAPYASLLAAQIAPKAALANLNYLKKLGAYGKYGFFDAIDFTAERLPQKPSANSHIIIKNYYTHHHGMSLIALYNLLHNNRMQDYFHDNAQMQAYELLLQEQAPRFVAFSNFKSIRRRQKTRSLFMEGGEIIIDQPQNSEKLLALSTGTQHIILTACGQSISQHSSLRLQPNFIITNHTTRQRFDICRKAYRTIFTASAAQLYSEQDDLEAKLNIIALAPGEHNFYASGLGYEINIVNNGTRTAQLQLSARLAEQSINGSLIAIPDCLDSPIELKPGGSQRFVLWYIIADVAKQRAKIHNYLSQEGSFELEEQKNWAFAQAKLFQMGISARQAASYQKLLPAIVKQPRPHIVIKINNKNYMPSLRDMLTACAYLRSHGLELRLTVLNEAMAQDFSQLDAEIRWLQQAYGVQHSAFDYINNSEAILQLEASEEEYFTLQAQRGFLAEQLAK